MRSAVLTSSQVAASDRGDPSRTSATWRPLADAVRRPLVSPTSCAPLSVLIASSAWRRNSVPDTLGAISGATSRCRSARVAPPAAMRSRTRSLAFRSGDWISVLRSDCPMATVIEKLPARISICCAASSVDDRRPTSKGRGDLPHSVSAGRGRASQMLAIGSGVRLSPPRGQIRDTLLGRSSGGAGLGSRGIRHMRGPCLWGLGTSLRGAEGCDSLPVSINTELTDFRQC